MASVTKTVKVLREAYRAAGLPINTAFFEWAGTVHSTPKETSFEELQAALGITKAETRVFASEIESAAIGKRIFGRRGLKSRIHWTYTLASVAKAARGLSDTLEPVSQSHFPAVREGSEIAVSADHADDAEHLFRLRSGRRVSFRLPRDLTAKEADRLAAFIKTLPLA